MPNYSPLFLPDTTEAIKRHAIACHPEEACGIVTADGFVAMKNVHATPLTHFDCHEQVVPYAKADLVLAIVHSHPRTIHEKSARSFPSAMDMEQQMAWDLPWGLCATEGTMATEPMYWGDMLPAPPRALRPPFWVDDSPVPPLIGRRFRHGPSGSDGKGDCYALIRDFYRVELGIELVEGPRDWCWWNTEKVEDGDLYEQNFARAGFRDVPKTDVRYGDVGLVLEPSADSAGRAMPLRVIHGCVYVGEGMVLHHRVRRLSCREPLREWNHFVKRWIRHSSQPD